MFNGSSDRTRSLLDIKTVRTIFGHKNRPYWKQILTEQQRLEVAVETPVYDLTVFKINHKRLTVKMRQLHNNRKIQYTTRQAAYDLKKLRAKRFITLPIKRGHSYKTTEERIKQMTAYIVLRDKVISLLLNNACKKRTGLRRYNVLPIDRHYKNIQTEMQGIFRYFKIAD